MSIPFQKPKKYEVYAERQRLNELANLLINSINNNDTKMMRMHAEQIHKLETTMILRKCSTVLYHMLQPVHASVWINIGMAIGALIMINMEINTRTNSIFLIASLLLSIMGEFIIYYGTKIGNAVTKTILNKSIKLTQQRAALIIERYRTKLAP